MALMSWLWGLKAERSVITVAFGNCRIRRSRRLGVIPQAGRILSLSSCLLPDCDGYLLLLLQLTALQTSRLGSLSLDAALTSRIRLQMKALGLDSGMVDMSEYADIPFGRLVQHSTTSVSQKSRHILNSKLRGWQALISMLQER